MPDPTSFLIRRATPEDLAELGVIAPSAYALAYGDLWTDCAAFNAQLETFSAGSFARLIDDPESRVLLARISGAIVGFLSLRFDAGDPAGGRIPAAQVHRIYLLPQAQRLGIGRGLMLAAADEAEAGGVRHLWLSTFAHAKAAIDTYRRWGFRPAGEALYEKPISPDRRKMLVMRASVAELRQGGPDVTHSHVSPVRGGVAVSEPRRTPEEACLVAALAPRPLVWITTCALDGAVNLAPFSAVTIICNAPPILLLAIERCPDGRIKRTAENIVSQGEFVVNSPSRKQLEQFMRSADPVVPASGRANAAAIRFTTSATVKPPLIKGCNSAFECRMIRHEQVGNFPQSDVFWGEVIDLHLRKAGRGGSARPFLGALGYEWFVSEQGTHFVEQPYLTGAI